MQLIQRFFSANILLVVIFSSGCTTLSGNAEKISPSALENRALVTGKLSVYSQRSGRTMQDYLGPKFITYATRSAPKKVYELLIPDEDGGYFAWLMEPGSYYFHHTQIREGGEETRLTDFDPIELRAGEILYLGDIHIEVGKRGSIARQNQLQQLTNQPVGAIVQGAEVPMAAHQSVNDGTLDMKEYLHRIGLLEGQIFRKKLTLEW